MVQVSAAGCTLGVGVTAGIVTGSADGAAVSAEASGGAASSDPCAEGSGLAVLCTESGAVCTPLSCCVETVTPMTTAATSSRHRMILKMTGCCFRIFAPFDYRI